MYRLEGGVADESEERRGTTRKVTKGRKEGRKEGCTFWEAAAAAVGVIGSERRQSEIWCEMLSFKKS
jgi:hypothetical protein